MGELHYIMLGRMSAACRDKMRKSRAYIPVVCYIRVLEIHVYKYLYKAKHIYVYSYHVARLGENNIFSKHFFQCMKQVKCF